MSLHGNVMYLSLFCKWNKIGHLTLTFDLEN